MFKNINDTLYRIQLIQQLLKELDSLYDDKSVENEEKEIECIESKIKIREELLARINVE